MICAIVLAAGQSRRMGVQKLLLPLGSKTVIAHVVDEVLRSTLGAVYVVVGCEATRITEALTGRRVTFVTNPDTEGDMLSSVRCGLQALPPQCKAAMVVLGDQPAITSALIDAMVRAFAETDKGILAPLYGGKRGHPILFSVRYRDEILERYDAVGLRGLLHAHSDDLLELRVANPGVLSDMDRPEDYQRERLLFDENTRKKRN